LNLMRAAAADEIAIYGYALAFVAFGGFLVYLFVSGRLQGTDAASRRRFVAALAATAAWSAAEMASALWPTRALEPLAALLDLLRYGTWLAFLIALFGSPDDGNPQPRPVQVLRGIATLALAAGALLLLLGLWQGPQRALVQPQIAAYLVLPLCGMLLVEQVFRGLAEDSRWNAKPVCLGLGLLFAFDIFLYSEALLFSRFDADAFSVRGAAHALAVPFLVAASRRGQQWIARLQVSRSAAFYSATLILVGGYLLLMAALGYYVRYFGGTWGRALQFGLLAVALAVLGVLVFSGSVRSWLRVFVGKHFFSYRYDYREEWLRFTALLSSKRSPQEMGEMIVRGLAKMVECEGGGLWTRAGRAGDFVQVVAWNQPATTHAETPDSALCSFLRGKGWVIDLDEFRRAPRRYGSLALPDWLLGSANGWLVVPLLAGDELFGFVLLSRPITKIKLNWEVLDLMKTAGRQAAGYLAQMQATEALLDARKFEAFNRMSAFVVHDLKNIVAQLSLMLKNAERLHANREFQQDMLLTVESSLEKMRRLMLQLREGSTPPGGVHGVELSAIARRLQKLAQSQGRELEVDIIERLATRGHGDRLERVLGHLVQNALDATPREGRVWLRVARFGGQVQVDVGDTGKGMDEAFIRDKLFRPFNTTKHQGMGIGTYESHQYIRELGGSITAQSAEGEGTLMTVLLPLFETQYDSDLMGLTSR
jgi:putative PEP-CTERM system histidine kinase